MKTEIDVISQFRRFPPASHKSLSLGTEIQSKLIGLIRVSANRPNFNFFSPESNTYFD